MNAKQATMLRCLLALVLVFAIHVAGMGRALAAASSGSGTVTAVPGAPVFLCHGAGRAPDGGPPSPHDCCDDCALGAPVLLPGAPDLTARARVGHVVAHARAVAWAPLLSRPRTPRLAQGPPGA